MVLPTIVNVCIEYEKPECFECHTLLVVSTPRMAAQIAPLRSLYTKTQPLNGYCNRCANATERHKDLTGN